MRAVGWILAWMLLAPPALVAATLSGASGSGISVQSSSGGGGGPPVANCTDDSNCLCDTITSSYPNVFDCEDFEDPALANTTDSPGTWETSYKGTVDTCVVDAADVDLNRAGFVGDADAIAEGKECLNQAYESNCVVTGETDCNEDGSGGTYSLGHMYRLGKNYGITGEWNFTGERKQTFSVSFLQKFSSNFSLQGGPAAKMNQYGDSDSSLFGSGNWHSACSPEIPTQIPFGGGVYTGGAPAGGAPTVRVGGACTATSIGTVFGVLASDYEWGTTWGPGEWGCWQGSLNPTGTGNYYRWRVWFTPVGGTATLIFDADMDFSNLIGGDVGGFQRMVFNSYFNGPGIPGSGWQLSDPGARWEDNFVFTSDSTPVPCNALSSSFPAP